MPQSAPASRPSSTHQADHPVADTEPGAVNVPSPESDAPARESDVEARESDVEARESDVEARESDVEARESDVEARESDAGARASDAGAAGNEGELPPPSLSHKLIMGTAVVAPLVGLVVAVVLLWQYGWMGWLYLGLLVGGWILTGLGITVGFHRLLSHRSFAASQPVRAFWTAMGCLSVEGSPLIWCAIHRRHHELSDHPGDPHSPRLHGESTTALLRGLFHAHVGWLFTGHWTSPDLQRYIPDLTRDRWLVAVDRRYYLLVLASLALPTAIAGLATMSWWGALMGLLWGGLVRILVTHHITWSINSICHVFGSRTYRTTDQSTNNLVCGILGLGEGWHNNHHAFPTSARHGLAWWQFDLSWLVIRGMQALGLAWNVRLPNERSLAEKRLV